MFFVRLWWTCWACESIWWTGGCCVGTCWTGGCCVIPCPSKMHDFENLWRLNWWLLCYSFFRIRALVFNVFLAMMRPPGMMPCADSESLLSQSQEVTVVQLEHWTCERSEPALVRTMITIYSGWARLDFTLIDLFVDWFLFIGRVFFGYDEVLGYYGLRQLRWARSQDAVVVPLYDVGPVVTNCPQFIKADQNQSSSLEML